MGLTTRDIPRIEAAIANAHGRTKWLLQVARLQVLMPEGVPIDVIAHDWGISEDEAEARLMEINTLSDDEAMIEPADPEAGDE
jgi:hypothetical protein